MAASTGSAASSSPPCVPAELLGGLDGDEPARGFIMVQDREIAEKSGRPPLAIKEISRVGVKKK